MAFKILITGATGMVGEGVLLHCLNDPNISEIRIVNRKHYELTHPKLKELLVPDFTKMDAHKEQISNYDACFFCAGISSIGMNEEKYTHITYDTTIAFAKAVSDVNPNAVFTYVSGSHTDSSEQGKTMWARVKGKTENDLSKIPFKGVYNFRPGVMLPVQGQKNWKTLYKILAKIIKFFAPKSVLSLNEVGKAMVNAVAIGYQKSVLEVSDIRALANQK